jgi:hypothetical protein
MRFKRLAIVTVIVGSAAIGYGGEDDAFTAAQALSPDLHDSTKALVERRRCRTATVDAPWSPF